ncbi:MAG: phosphoribosylformylglycinamidine synthase subunit PurL, partial [Solirubrobacterales bacterium]
MSAVAESRHRQLGLTDAEYGRIGELLGREPNDTELAMFSLLWSEHCAYKHSRKLLRRLPTEGERVLMGPGENAGAVEIGDGYAIAFKVESHNHPSAVEPFQGAATGVGGILRDVFAIGARPIAVLDSLRFGELDSERSRYLFEGAVAGIGHYGNSIGVPTVGGELGFEPPYEHNCLINAMCVGLARTEEMVRSAAVGPGNLVVLIGVSTGRDGIGGASVLASAELEAGDDAKRPSVQIGDPFEESKLLECCLELLQRDLLVSLQDLGAAGLTSSAGEMASKGGVGIEIDVGRVPLREADLEPFEVMISESQERMLAVVEPAKLEQVVAACERWQTGVAAIGEVSEGGHLRVVDGTSEVADVPVAALVDECPLYDLEPAEPREWGYGNRSTLGERVALSAGRSADPADPSAILMALLGSPNVASARWAFEQYDSVVGSRTAKRPEAADAAVLMVPEAGGAIAVSIDGNGRRVACDPYTGTVEAVLECAQNLACVGAEPLGLTNCLNFGNPEKPTVAWQLDRAVTGLADACRELGIPVVGGNVSLYNETEEGPIYPTPIVGMVGELPDPALAAGIGPREGDQLLLVGPFAPSLAGSDLVKLRGELDLGLPATQIGPVASALAVVRE